MSDSTVRIRCDCGRELLAVLGALLGVLVSLYLARIGFFEGIRAPAQLQGSIAEYFRRNDLLYGGLAVTLGGGLAFGAASWLARWYYPSTRVSTRRQTIDVTLPHAIVYMYALSYGGMELTETVRRLADAEDSYGEVAREFDQIIRDVDVFGTDVVTALENARNITPSDNVEQFLDDLLSVLDAGGDVTPFLETLAILSELFITAFVAAPLFVIVILVVISLLGGQTLSQAALLIYAVIPLGMAGFFVLIDTLSEPFSQVGARIEEERRGIDADAAEPEAMAADGRLTVYRRQRRREAILRFLRDPLARFRSQPLASLVATVPLALLAVGGAVVLGGIEPSLDAMLAIAAEDARNRYRLDRARVRELSSYTAIVVIGFLVYLLVVLVLDSSYLQPIADLRAGGEIESGAPGAPARFGTLPIESYRLLFFHSALLQGVGSGLLAGKIAENSAAKGLKYAIGLVVVSVGAFVLV